MALSSALSIVEISSLLREMGEVKLADRLDYLASDEDLEPGESPITLESTQAFFELFVSVEYEGTVGLGSSHEGWVYAQWSFPDERALGVWFVDKEYVKYTARDKTGKHIDIEGSARTIDLSTLMHGLVQKELFSWHTS